MLLYLALVPSKDATQLALVLDRDTDRLRKNLMLLEARMLIVRIEVHLRNLTERV